MFVWLPRNIRNVNKKIVSIHATLISAIQDLT